MKKFKKNVTKVNTNIAEKYKSEETELRIVKDGGSGTYIEMTGYKYYDNKTVFVAQLVKLSKEDCKKIIETLS